MPDANIPPPPPTPRELRSDLRDVAARARLSIECYGYTREPYWLTCAYTDSQKAGLNWKKLCQTVLGEALPAPDEGELLQQSAPRPRKRR